MKPAAFRYERPRFVEETVALLAAHGPEAKVLAGGQSLMPLLNMRLVRPRILVDIMGIVGLDSMRVEDGHLAIGAAVRDRDVELWPEARARCPMLTEALRWVGHVEIRNRGTVCGSLAHADPAAELPVVAVALDATLIATSARGARAIPAADFFRALMTTALAEDELLTEVRVPAPAPGTGWAFVEFARRQGDFALAVVAALIERTPDGTCRRARLTLGGADAVPVRAHAAEQTLLGERLTPERVAAAAREAASSVNPPSDVHASAAYRRALVAVLVERALALAAARAPEPA